MHSEGNDACSRRAVEPQTDRLGSQGNSPPGQSAESELPAKATRSAGCKKRILPDRSGLSVDAARLERCTHGTRLTSPSLIKPIQTHDQRRCAKGQRRAMGYCRIRLLCLTRGAEKRNFRSSRRGDSRHSLHVSIPMEALLRAPPGQRATSIPSDIGVVVAQSRR